MMQITNVDVKPQFQVCEFGTLSYGDVFEYMNEVLMKIQPVTVTRVDGDVVYGVVDLRTGYSYPKLSDDCLVYVLIAHMNCEKILQGVNK